MADKVCGGIEARVVIGKYLTYVREGRFLTKFYFLLVTRTGVLQPLFLRLEIFSHVHFIYIFHGTNLSGLVIEK
jgi:hypothetical protein